MKQPTFPRLRLINLLTLWSLVTPLAIAVPAMAEEAVADALAVAVQPSVETYDPSAPVSGSPIAGIAIGRASGTLPLDGLQLVAPRSDATFCVHAITQDGRYTLRGTYKAPASGPADVLAIRPLTHRYAKELGEVKAEQFAVKAFLATNGNCHPSTAIHLPQVAGRGAVLVVAVNGGSRSGCVSAWKIDPVVRGIGV
ncbi:hypothetical protein [Xanthobacter autotrophicus]|uniref:hypothetical protein n=1 Tax=Xanthobacter autotrophicus TaxID=280 RepID=UPI00372BFA19